MTDTYIVVRYAFGGLQAPDRRCIARYDPKTRTYEDFAEINTTVGNKAELTAHIVRLLNADAELRNER